MASTFTLNFCLSGINGNNQWGSFNQPGLLSFGVFRVSISHRLSHVCNTLGHVHYTLSGSIHFLEGGYWWAGGIPMSMNVKSPSPPFIFFVKK